MQPLILEQRAQGLIEGPLGQFLQLRVGPTLNRMPNKNHCRAGPERVFLRFNGRCELIGSDQNGRNSIRLVFGQVVQTARYARPSIGEGLDHRHRLG